MTIAVDFDGTIVEHKYPTIGREKPFAIETLKKLVQDKHQLILWTVREGKLLEEAVGFCQERGLEFYAVNQNYPEEYKQPQSTLSRKLKADLWIDDRNLGGLPDWGTIYRMIHDKLTFHDLILQQEEKDAPYPKPGFFKCFFRKIFFLLSGIVCLIASGCTSYKEIPYLQESDGKLDSLVMQPLYDARIMPKDLLTITVNTTNPEAAAPFNLSVQSAPSSKQSIPLTQQATLQQYLVDNQGNIQFPVLGTLQLGGLTKNEAETLIRERLKPYLREEPIVTVRMANYKISVLGEVANPGNFTIDNEKINILEALAMAGDMTIWGLRDNVKLVREGANGQKKIVEINLNQADLIHSPYYYLQQNDILYVSPNKTKARNSDIGQSTSLWVSATSILVSVANLLVTIFK